MFSFHIWNKIVLNILMGRNRIHDPFPSAALSTLNGLAHSSRQTQCIHISRQETTCGTENTMARKHAYIRFETTTGAFEVELEDVPSIFVVSHATGR